MAVALQQSLILFLLALDALDCLTILDHLLVVSFGGGFSELCESYLGLGDILSEDIVDIAVLFLLLGLDLLLPAGLKDVLELCLLLGIELVRVFEEFDQLVLAKLLLVATKLACWAFSLAIILSIDVYHLNWLAILVDILLFLPLRLLHLQLLLVQ